jgi:hypothetical protein
MAIQKEIWVNALAGNLFKDNPFVRIAQNHDQYVMAGKVVHIPQAGAVPVVQKNRTVFPATAERRTDTDITYNLDEFTSDPTHIQNAEMVELSYDKVMNVLQEHLEKINEVSADELLYRWALGLPTTNMIDTTGDAVATHLDGATGNRKLFVKENLKAMQLAFNKQNISKNDRYALFDSDMLGQLQDDPDLKKRDGITGGELDLKNGVITRLYGFNIIERSDVLRLTGDTVLAPGVVNVAASNAGVFCWQKNSVASALGTVNFFEDIASALYYGDIYSALVRFGGCRHRQDNKGVGFIRQAASA